MNILDARLSRPLEGGPSFTRRNRLFRLLWRLGWLLLAAWTPPPLAPWRRLVLIAFGARLAPGARVHASARIWYPPHLAMGAHALMGPNVECYNIAPIEIGDRTVVSQGASLCTGSHDLRDRHFQLVARPIRLGREVWIAADAFVGPGVVAHDGAVLSARAVTFAALEAWTVYRGNPAQAFKTRTFRADSPAHRASRIVIGNFSASSKL